MLSTMLIVANVCSVNCTVELIDNEMVMFSLQNCAPCEKMKKTLDEYGIVYRTVDLQQYNRVNGIAHEILFAPTIVRKQNGTVEILK